MFFYHHDFKKDRKNDRRCNQHRICNASMITNNNFDNAEILRNGIVNTCMYLVQAKYKVHQFCFSFCYGYLCFIRKTNWIFQLIFFSLSLCGVKSNIISQELGNNIPHKKTNKLKHWSQVFKKINIKKICCPWA